MPSRRITAAIAVAIGLLIFPSTALAVPKLLGGTELHFEVRPKHILVSGDGTAWIGGLGYRQSGQQRPSNYGGIRWLRFNRHEALGRGYMWLNNCVPNCGEGSFFHFRARIRASDVRDNRYQHMLVRFRFHGRKTSDHYHLMEPGESFFIWG